MTKTSDGLAHARMLTMRDVAAALGVSERTVRRWVRDGTLAAHRLGRQVRIAPADVSHFLNLRRRGGAVFVP